MSELRIIFLVFTLVLVTLGLGTVRVSENMLDLDDPFSDTFFKWIRGDIALALTSYNQTYEVWRTQDSGQTWYSLKSRMEGSEQSINQPGFLYLNPADNTKIYVRGQSTKSWISSDMGETWTVISPQTNNGEYKRFINLDWHPKRAEWALAAVSVDFFGPDEIYYTTDFGRTWKFIAKAYQYTWGDAGSGDVHDDTVYLLVDDATSGFQNMVLTTDFGAHYKVLQSKSIVFLFRDKQLFTLLYLPTPNKAVLKVTPDVGNTYKQFYDASFPFGSELDYRGYAILDDSTGAVYLGVSHGDTNTARWGNVYVSNSIGDRYSVSSAHVSQLWPLFDFTKIYGLDGIYISNVVENWQQDVSQRDSKLQTFVTMDNGGVWNMIEKGRPHFDSQGKPIICTGPCYLHLHALTSLPFTFGPVYSTSSALGLILATGNVGEYLELEHDKVSTYLSRDGGLNWIELMKGSTIYEFGDHGGIIVLAPYGQATNKVYYTLDQGLTPLKELIITNDSIEVVNVRIEPTATSERFMVIGIRDERGVMISLDFSNVFDRTCDASDYEPFTPSNGKTENNGLQCLLGRDVTYQRRRANSTCFNDEVVEPKLSEKICQCTEDDWECDYGYDRAIDGSCQFILPAPLKYPPPYCPEGKSYNKTNGYRLVAGTYCSGGVSHWGDGPYKCPKGSNGSKNYGWVAAVVVMGLIILLLVAAFFAMRSEWLREKVPFVKKLHGWKVGYFGMQNEPDTIGEPEGGEDEFAIGGVDEEKPAAKLLESKEEDDSFNPRA